MSEQVLVSFEVLDTDVHELKVMYWLAQAMENEELEEDERIRIVEWFNARYNYRLREKHEN